MFHSLIYEASKSLHSTTAEFHPCCSLGYPQGGDKAAGETAEGATAGGKAEENCCQDERKGNQNEKQINTGSSL